MHEQVQYLCMDLCTYVPTDIFISQLICIPFRFSLLPALSSNGIILSDICEGTYNSAAFVESPATHEPLAGTMQCPCYGQLLHL